MFETAEVGRSLSKDEFKTLEPKIHERVLSLQRQLRESNHPLIIIVSGVEGAGKGEVVDRLNRWFDTRDVQTHAYWEETDEERQRPRFWRFWRTMPARGSVCVMFGSWYTKPIVDAALSRTSMAVFEQEMRCIAELEKTLTDDSTVIIKLWFHLPKSVQKKRLEEDAKVSKFKKSPLLEEFSRSYDQFANISERALRLTDTGNAPWQIIEATDFKFRDVAVGETIIEALEKAFESDTRLQAQAESAQSSAKTNQDSTTEDKLVANSHNKTVLDTVDLKQNLTDDVYSKQIDIYQKRLYELAWEMNRQKKNTMVVFEGWDAAGKGSAIRRVTAAIDARLYRVIPISAPTDEELAHHYLWRFWRHIPRAGYMTIYDRSWYGRVLVERVEGFASTEEWMRAYNEINGFEEHLVNHGIALFKFWIHIDQAEQLKRFKERELEPRKQHKITEDDWRNRSQYEAYKEAVNDMVAHTSTARAPWTLVAGNDKKIARIKILSTLCKGLESALDLADGNIQAGSATK